MSTVRAEPVGYQLGIGKEYIQGEYFDHHPSFAVLPKAEVEGWIVEMRRIGFVRDFSVLPIYEGDVEDPYFPDPGELQFSRKVEAE